MSKISELNNLIFDLQDICSTADEGLREILFDKIKVLKQEVADIMKAETAALIKEMRDQREAAVQRAMELLSR